MHYEETMKIGVNEYKYFHSNIAVYVESRGLLYAWLHLLPFSSYLKC